MKTLRDWGVAFLLGPPVVLAVVLGCVLASGFDTSAYLLRVARGLALDLAQWAVFWLHRESKRAVSRATSESEVRRALELRERCSRLRDDWLRLRRVAEADLPV